MIEVTILAFVGIIAVTLFDHSRFKARLLVRYQKWMQQRGIELDQAVIARMERSVPRVTGPAYDPLRYSWRRAQLSASYPGVLREPATIHDVRTCPTCRTEMPTWNRACPSCKQVLGR